MIQQDAINSLSQNNFLLQNPNVKESQIGEDQNIQQSSIIFTFSNGQSATYDFSLLLDISPLLYAKLQLMRQQNTGMNIDLPDYITFQNLNDFICLVKNNCMMIDETNSRTTELINVLRTSEYFQNEIYSAKIINDLVLMVLSTDNVFEYFDFCYWKIKAIIDKKGMVETFWMNFLVKCFEVIERNFFENEIIQKKVMKYNEKIIEEIINRLMFKIITGDIEVTKEKINILVKMILIIRKQKSYFVSIVNENLIKQNDFFFDKKIEDPTSRQVLIKPTLQVEIGKYELYYYYKEIKVDLVDKDIFNFVFVLYYDNKKDNFEISIKIDSNNSKSNSHLNYLSIISLSSEIILSSKGNTSNIHKKQSQLFLHNCLFNKNPLFLMETVNNISSMIKIVKPTTKSSSFSFSSSLPHKAKLYLNGTIQSTGEIDSILRNDSLSLSISLKVNYIQTVLMSDIVSKFSSYYDDKSIEQIDKAMLTSIMSNKILNKTNEDEIVIALLNWLDNDSNCKQNINDILSLVNWENVSYELIIELAVKYPSISKEVKNMIIFFVGKNNNNEAIKRYFVNSMITAIKKIDYITMFSKLKKCDTEEKLMKKIISTSTTGNTSPNNRCIDNTVVSTNTSDLFDFDFGVSINNAKIECENEST